jgi:tetratricopeptide (TPR) repeat protein
MAAAMVICACAKSQPAVAAPTSVVAQRNFVELDRQLLSLLQKGNFDQLESLLATVIREYEADRRKERQVEVAFDTFHRAPVNLERPLNNWVQAKPDSYSAHLARASFYNSMAWLKRGAGDANHTSPEQFARMHQYLAKAARDLSEARRLKPDAVLPIVYQMEGLVSDGNREQAQRLYEEALALDPTSLAARWQYLWSLVPRWGGTIRQMQEVIADARPYYGRNPTLKVLEGRIEAELGDQAMFNDNCEAAERHYTNALTIAEHWYYYQRAALRSYCYGRQVVDVVGKLRRAIELRPNVVTYDQTAFLMGQSLYALDLYDEAIAYLSLALKINPNDHSSRQVRGDSYYRIQMMDLARADFEENIRQVPDSEEYAADLELLNTQIEKEGCERNPTNPTGPWVCLEH